MKNPVGYFEIPVNNLDRAIGFYEKVFDYEFERANVDGNEMAWFPFDEDAPGISGALAKGESYSPTTKGSLIYFTTDSIEDTLSKVNLNGGRTLYPKTSVGEFGWVAEFEDTEGNRIALHSQ
jgi:uncharacterized protein